MLSFKQYIKEGEGYSEVYIKKNRQDSKDFR